jgi:hypothetical protein
MSDKVILIFFSDEFNNRRVVSILKKNNNKTIDEQVFSFYSSNEIYHREKFNDFFGVEYDIIKQ